MQTAIVRVGPICSYGTRVGGVTFSTDDTTTLQGLLFMCFSFLVFVFCRHRGCMLHVVFDYNDGYKIQQITVLFKFKLTPNKHFAGLFPRTQTACLKTSSTHCNAGKPTDSSTWWHRTKKFPKALRSLPCSPCG